MLRFRRGSGFEEVREGSGGEGSWSGEGSFALGPFRDGGVGRVVVGQRDGG